MTLKTFIETHRTELDEHIAMRLGKPKNPRPNDEERMLWVLNDEDLYLWAKLGDEVETPI